MTSDRRAALDAMIASDADEVMAIDTTAVRRAALDNQKHIVTMTDNNRHAALVEKVGRALAENAYAQTGITLTDPYTPDADHWNSQATAAIDLIRAEVLEEALQALYSVPRWDREIFDSLTQTADGSLIYIEETDAAIRALSR